MVNLPKIKPKTIVIGAIFVVLNVALIAISYLFISDKLKTQNTESQSNNFEITIGRVEKSSLGDYYVEVILNEELFKECRENDCFMIVQGQDHDKEPIYLSFLEGFHIEKTEVIIPARILAVTNADLKNLEIRLKLEVFRAQNNTILYSDNFSEKINSI